MGEFRFVPPVPGHMPFLVSTNLMWENAMSHKLGNDVPLRPITL